MGQLRNPQVVAALATAMRIQELITSLDDATRTKAADFFDSVGKKAESIGETIDRLDRVSDGQMGALTNIEAAVRKWIHPPRAERS
jgi:hypothetical protein